MRISGSPVPIFVAHRIIAAMAIEVQAVDGFGGEVGSIIGRDKSAPFGAVISGVAVIQAGVVIVVIAAIANGVGLCLHSTIFPASSQEKCRTRGGAAQCVALHK